MPTIYKLTNSVDNRVYVGSTKQDLRSRMSKHVYKCNHGYTSKLYTAMRELGTKSFSIEPLESIDTTDAVLLRERERYYVEALGSIAGGLNTVRPIISAAELVELKARNGAAHRQRTRESGTLKCESCQYVADRGWSLRRHLSSSTHIKKVLNLI